MNKKKVEPDKKNVNKDEIKILKDRCKELEEGWKRSQADFLNYKKRSEEERNSVMAFARIEVVLSMLPVYDSCQRAIEMIEGNKEGLLKIIESFESILKGYDIEPVRLANDVFDANLAEAIGFEKGNKDQDGKIAKVVETGFKLGDRLIRPSKVILYKS